MRRFSLIVLAAAAASAQAQAQAQVTLSGTLDLGVKSVSNTGVGSQKSMSSGANSTSRIIVSGREDLGDSLWAGFHLEHGLLADTGAAASASKFWDRRSTVSLGHSRWGELRLGRDFVPSYSNWSRYDPFAYVGVARSANFVSASPTGPIRSAFGSNANTTVRSDNAVQFLLPGGLGGVEGSAMVAAGEGGAVASGLAKVIGLRLGYATKTWGVSAATTSSENSLTTDGKFKDTAIGGHAELAGVRLTAAWRQFDIGQAEQVLWLVGAVYSQGVHEFKASWNRSDMRGSVGTTALGANDASQWGLGYVYNLSKRSVVYASVARISNDGASRYTIADGPSGMAAGGSSSGYELGLRHRF